MPNQPFPFFALTTRGLEVISAAETAIIPEVSLTETGYRRIAGITSNPAALLALRTVDDVFLSLATWDGIARPRTTLDRIGTLAARLDLRAVGVIRSLRELPEKPAFAVSASFVGPRNYATDEIKLALAAGVTRLTGWPYVEQDSAAPLSLRLFIEHEIAHLGIRLAARPLQDRPYRRLERPGALKSPVAAAMLTLAGLIPDMRILDPCCGTGTIPIEAALLGATSFAADHDPEALAATRLNARASGVTFAAARMDAATLALADTCIDAIVVNLPWGRQTTPAINLPALYAGLAREAARTLKPSARLVTLTTLPHLISHPALRQIHDVEISLFGQRPHLTVFET